jgi:hypothetical protein
MYDVDVKSEVVVLAPICTDALRGWAQGTQGVFPSYDANKCQRVRVAGFILVQNTKIGKIFTKRPQNLPSGHKTPNTLHICTYVQNGNIKYKLAINCVYQKFPFQGPKITKIEMFGMQKYAIWQPWTEWRQPM